MTGSALFRLIGIVFTAVTCIVIGDTAGKLLTSGGVDPFLVAWARFGLAAIVLLPFSGLAKAELPALLNWRILLRSVFVVGGICGMLTALKTEPLANVFGAFFVGPIVSYILAIIFLGEKPSALRGWLLALGFLGVMLVVKPGFGASAGIFYALGAGVFYGAYLVMTRTVAGQFRPRFLLISQLLIGTAVLTPFGLSVEMPTVTQPLILLLTLSALASALGNYLLVVANKTAEASLIAPLIYTQLISATVLGVLVFGEWPDTFALMGLVLIAASGFGSLIASQSRLLKKHS